jgi:1,2-diacylglycerol 3-alpha-glucosyltransferase/glucuronosyltransferase
MKLLLISDAWHPQVNGVVRTLSSVVRELGELGHSVRVAEPSEFKTVPCPTYPEIRLAIQPVGRLRRIAEEFEPEALHIATEGPLGLAGRDLARRSRWPFTTSFHTRFPEYVRARTGVPLSWGWGYLRWFHSAAERVLASTPTLQDELKGQGLSKAALWSRGVDTDLFRPQQNKLALAFERPIALYVGRIAVEKNLEAFLKLDLPGSKVLIGDGPARADLERRYPQAHFLGALHGAELAQRFAAGDVFVFPSRTDTYGLVMLEALACGLPVAAFPVAGPLDVITDERVGALDQDLGAAIRRALELDPAECVRYARERSWRACAERFLALLEPFAGSRQRDAG